MSATGGDTTGAHESGTTAPGGSRSTRDRSERTGPRPSGRLIAMDYSVTARVTRDRWASGVSVLSWMLLLIAASLDYLTTRLGLAAGIAESNPVAAAAINQLGLEAAVVALKLPAVALVAILWLVLPAEYRDLGVSTLALVWAVAALWNSYAVHVFLT